MAKSLKRECDEHIKELEKATDKRVTIVILKKQKTTTPARDKRVTSAVKTLAKKGTSSKQNQ